MCPRCPGSLWGAGSKRLTEVHDHTLLIERSSLITASSDMTRKGTGPFSRPNSPRPRGGGAPRRGAEQVKRRAARGAPRSGAASANEDVQGDATFSVQVKNKAVFPPTLWHGCALLGLKWGAT